MSERQFNTLLQLIAQQGERIEYIVQEMKQGFANQAATILDILTHVDERFDEHEKRCQLFTTAPTS